MSIGTRAFLILALASGAAAAAHEAAAPVIDGRRAIEYSQAAIGGVLGDHVLTAADGRPLALARLRGRPLLVSMIFTSCDHTCPLITHSLRNAIETADANFGRAAYNVLTVGFDVAQDTPARMRSFAFNQGVDQPNWHFASGDAATIAGLAAELGFLFAPSPRGFDHLAQTTLVDADGRVYRQVYGSDFRAPAIVDPLKQLILGGPVEFTRISTLWDRLKLICTVYDPAQDRYRFSYAIFIGIAIGAAILAGTGAIVVRLWMRQRAAA